MTDILHPHAPIRCVVETGRQVQELCSLYPGPTHATLSSRTRINGSSSRHAPVRCQRVPVPLWPAPPPPAPERPRGKKDTTTNQWSDKFAHSRSELGRSAGFRGINRYGSGRACIEFCEF